MKLILTQEVTGLGAPGDVVEVKDGYGRNYLVPRGEAIRWTRGAEKTIESIKNARTARAVRDHDSAEAIKAKLEAVAGPGQGPGRRGRPPLRRRHRHRHRRGPQQRLGPGGRQADHRGRQPDQVARRPRGDRPAARRGVRHGGAQRHPCLTSSATTPTAPPAPVSRAGPSWRPGVRRAPRWPVPAAAQAR